MTVSSAAIEVRLNSRRRDQVVAGNHDRRRAPWPPARPGANLKSKRKATYTKNGHHRVEERHDALVAQLLAHLRADVVDALDLRSPARRRPLLSALGHLVRHARGHDLVVELPAALRRPRSRTSLTPRPAAATRRLHRRPAAACSSLRKLMRPFSTSGLKNLLVSPIACEGPLRHRLRILRRQLGDAPQPQEEAVLARRANALHADVLQARRLRPGCAPRRRCIGWSNFTSTTVPPAKSTPKLKPTDQRGPRGWPG